MQETGFEGMEACVLRRLNTAAEYIVMCPILNLYEATVQIPGMWVVKRWREKELLDLLGVWEVTAASEDEFGGGRDGGRSRGSSGKVNNGIN